MADILQSVMGSYGFVMIIGEIIGIATAVIIVLAIIKRKKEANAKAKRDLESKADPVSTTSRATSTSSRTSSASSRTSSASSRTSSASSRTSSASSRTAGARERFAQNDLVNQWAQDISKRMYSDIEWEIKCQNKAWTEEIKVDWELFTRETDMSFHKGPLQSKRDFYVKFEEFRVPDLSGYEISIMESVIKEKVFSMVKQRIEQEGLCDAEWKLSDEFERSGDGYRARKIKFILKNKEYIELQKW